MEAAGIYKITNKQDGKVYIGQSTNVKRRIQEHQQARTVTIDDYINVLGKENFTYEIIDYCSPELLDEKEKYYIQQYDSSNSQKGYNIQEGGFNNSSGEGNGRALLTEQDVIVIRQAYNNHKSQKEIYKLFEDKITFNQFQGVWQGRSWTNIMPEVYTEENKAFYSSGGNSHNRTLTNEQVLQLRKEYVNATGKEIWNNHPEFHELMTERSFTRMLQGDIKGYKHIPIYKKSKKMWLLDGNPVSTIHGSVE